MVTLPVALAAGLGEEVSRGRVLLLGATGQIGIFTIPRLVAAGFEVTALSRNPRPGWYPQFETVSWKQADVLQCGSLEEVGAEVDMLVSAGPVRLAGRVVEQSPQLERAVVFSTSSVFTKLESPDPGEKQLMQRILADEAGLSAACDANGTGLSIYRPTLIYGCGMDGNVSWLAKWIQRFGFMPVAGDAAGLRQPVHADDLAGAAVATLRSDTPLTLDVPLCGGSTLSFREMAESIFHGLDKPVRILGIPGGLLRALTYAGSLVPGLRGVRPEMVRRQNLDLVFDDSTPREVLHYRPRPFTPGAADFSLPDPALITRLAGR